MKLCTTYETQIAPKKEREVTSDGSIPRYMVPLTGRESINQTNIARQFLCKRISRAREKGEDSEKIQQGDVLDIKHCKKYA